MNLLLVFFLSLSSLLDQAKAVANKPNIQDERVVKLEQRIADEYEKCGDICVDRLLDGLPTDWYRGIDLYINHSDAEVIHMMTTDLTAFYKNAKSVSVSAESFDGYSIIVVVSY
ncbi:MAG TPA: hypothetical protein VL443_24295 [Cyclobacteriaceae bacterium]|jgi:hypothetical protein|nr:hypothetical protein [Cyclobacteriaceae bacterium]